MLLSGIKHNDLHSLKTQHPIDIVIFDKQYDKNEIDKFLFNKLINVRENCSVLTLENNTEDVITAGLCVLDKVYPHTVLGGTFDRLHIAHKLLLTEAMLRARTKVTIGVTEENMLKSKSLWELIEPVNYRIAKVKEFMNDVCPELEANVVPITDPYGPTQNDPTMDLLVVSAETSRGGAKVNEGKEQTSLKQIINKLDFSENR